MKFKLYNDTLNKDLWDDNLNLDKSVRLQLLKVANDFYKQSELKAPIKDVILLGSSTNYNWTKYSDLDTHIVIDFKDLDSGEYAKQLTDLVKSNWNDIHDIKVKGYNVELYIQDVNDKPHSESSFSIMHNKWLKKPTKKDKLSVNKELIKKKFNLYKDRIDNLINNKCESPETCETSAKTLFDDIKRMRQSGLDKNGELSEENIVFKLLRNTKYLEKLWNAKIDFYDAQFNENLIEFVGTQPFVSLVGDTHIIKLSEL
jgi:hypothetical protein